LITPGLVVQIHAKYWHSKKFENYIISLLLGAGNAQKRKSVVGWESYMRTSSLVVQIHANYVLNNGIGISSDLTFGGAGDIFLHPPPPWIFLGFTHNLKTCKYENGRANQ